MTRRALRKAASVLETRALLLKSVAFGDSDLVITLMTQSYGRLSALARAARRSQRRFGGALQPMHTLEVRLLDRHSELMVLSEAQIVEARTFLIEDYERLNAAGRALRWVRHAAPPNTIEPNVWEALLCLLERLDDRSETRPNAIHLAAAGLRLIAGFGWGLNLSHCVRCGKLCPEASSSMLSPKLGGIVCRSCGGAPIKLSGFARARLVRAASGDPDALTLDDAELCLSMIEQVLKLHSGLE